MKTPSKARLHHRRPTVIYSRGNRKIVQPEPEVKPAKAKAKDEPKE